MDDEADFLANLSRLADQRKARREVDTAEAIKHKPDWSHWTNLALVRIDDAVVLSCDIDPVWHGNKGTIQLVFQRKAIAESHMAAGTLETHEPYKRLSLDAGDRVVPLSEFRRWGEALPIPFTFPDEFPRTGQLRSVTKALDPRERNNMLRLIRALEVISRLPARGATPSIEKQLQELGFDGPKDATIRKLLEEARSIEPDSKPQ